MNMSLKLDDLLVKKKEAVQILDLSKSTANTKEELKKLLERVPEFKIKIEKVKPEDVKIHDKKFVFKTPKKELKKLSFPFMNPIPIEMKSVCLDDLCSIAIQWKMLTSLRPKNKLDEEYFSKLVELGKSQLTSREKEKGIPLESFIKKSKNRAGVLETTIVSCRGCGEEFCSSETCRQVAYELYERENITRLSDSANMEDDLNEQRQRKIHKPNRKKKIKSRNRIPRRRGKTITLKISSVKNSSSKGNLEKEVKLKTSDAGRKIGKSSQQKIVRRKTKQNSSLKS